ncbi:MULTISPECIES: thioredoxin family protein [unclassified Mycoplasma]|uniref:thioredoxin family protein n=1 Tax=unclassified Mycoplasma TaxID=2683645 RepID=UPI002B1E7E4F|nr:MULTISPECIES: thioredoxin family protein [unclassified Mycoplasma]MEA4191294.1 thioredoxin family protein [Mycoplasma sp. 2248]MEA4206442.1 thioredoxin family protein [Mycoplasma sp. 1199]
MIHNDLTKQDVFSLLDNSKGVKLLVFYADWCGPCKMLYANTLTELDQKDNAEILRVNIDKNRDFAREMNITSIPYIQIYKDAKYVTALSGYLPYSELKSVLDKVSKE